MTSKTVIDALEIWLRKHLPIYEHIGATVEQVGEVTRCRLPLNNKNKNHFNAVHAALQFAVMELAGGVAGKRSPVISSEKHLLMVKSLKIDFLKPALSAVEAVVHLSDSELQKLEAVLLKDGRVEFDLDCDLIDESGEIVSKSVAVYYVRARKPD